MKEVKPADILAIGVHPDDVELACCGTLALQIDLGNTVGLLDLTRGEKGTRGNAEIRTQEAFQSAKLMSAAFRYQLDFDDCFFEYNFENIVSIVKIIRASKPKIVFANALSDRHPDHGRAAKLIRDACFYSGLIKIETEWNQETQEAWRPQAVYHYIQDHQEKPDFVMDISKYIDKKIKLISCFKSQFYNPESTEPNSPISSKEFMEFVRSASRVMGRWIHVDYGEGFHLARPAGLKNIFHLDL